MHISKKSLHAYQVTAGEHVLLQCPEPRPRSTSGVLGWPEADDNASQPCAALKSDLHVLSGTITPLEPIDSLNSTERHVCSSGMSVFPHVKRVHTV